MTTEELIVQIKCVISTSLSDTQIECFLTCATATISKCEKTFEDDVLDQIKIYLTAHLMTLREPLETSEKFEGWSRTLLRQSAAKGVLSTPYGQQANILADGCLANLGLRKTQVLFL